MLKKDKKVGLYVFRLPESLDDELIILFEKSPVLGVKSKHQFARKIVTDYLSGRLIYVDARAEHDNSLLH